MVMLNTIAGFSLFGLASRFGQLGIQKRPLLDKPVGHLIAIGVFGFAGYWAEVWDQHAAGLVAQRRAQIEAKREALAKASET